MTGGDDAGSGRDTAQSMEALMASLAETGDRRAFAALFSHFAPRVKGFLMKGGASPDEAEDVAQEVMVKVLHKAKLFDKSKASAATWIFTIARNARIDALRRSAKPDLDPNEPMLAPEEAPRADFICELKDRSARIRAAMEKLPAEQQEAMRLHFFEDEAHSAIAERLNLPLGTVKSRLRLAIDKMRSALEDDLRDDVE